MDIERQAVMPNPPHCPTGPLVEQCRRTESIEQHNRRNGSRSSVVADFVAAAVKVVLGVSNAAAWRERRHAA
jgi:hypothetical protein